MVWPNWYNYRKGEVGVEEWSMGFCVNIRLKGKLVNGGISRKETGFKLCFQF